MWGGTDVMYVVGFGKESLSDSLLMSSMVHVKGIFLSMEARWRNRGRRFGPGVMFFMSGS